MDYSEVLQNQNFPDRSGSVHKFMSVGRNHPDYQNAAPGSE